MDPNNIKRIENLIRIRDTLNLRQKFIYSENQHLRKEYIKMKRRFNRKYRLIDGSGDRVKAFEFKSYLKDDVQSETFFKVFFTMSAVIHEDSNNSFLGYIPIKYPKFFQILVFNNLKPYPGITNLLEIRDEYFKNQSWKIRVEPKISIGQSFIDYSLFRRRIRAGSLKRKLRRSTTRGVVSRFPTHSRKMTNTKSTSTSEDEIDQYIKDVMNGKYSFTFNRRIRRGLRKRKKSRSVGSKRKRKKSRSVGSKRKRSRRRRRSRR